MIVPPTNVRVLIATKPVDFRKGMDGLAALIAAELRLEPYSGVIYVFRSKRADRVKLLFWDGTGVCLLAKRLEGEKFRWPKVEDGVMRLSPAQLTALLEGLEWGACPCAACRPSHSGAVIHIPAREDAGVASAKSSILSGMALSLDDLPDDVRP
jgi:transposase